jgi:hypothetical protein
LNELSIISNEKVDCFNTIIIDDDETINYKNSAIRKVGNNYELMDMSKNTFLCRNGRERKLLKPLEWIKINNQDFIFIGNTRLKFSTTVFQANSSNSDLNTSESQIESDDYSQSQYVYVNGRRSKVLASPTQQFQDASTQEDEIEELPETQKNNTIVKMEVDRSQEDQQFDDDLTQDFFGNAAVKMEFDEETQPLKFLPPRTRGFTKKQELIKPNTRPLTVFEETQMLQAKYNAETQCFVPKKSKKTIYTFNGKRIEDLQPTEKVNSILLSEEEVSTDEDELIDSQEISDKNNSQEASIENFSQESSIKNDSQEIDSLNTTPDIPEIPSQSIDSQFLECVNQTERIDEQKGIVQDEEDEEAVFFSINDTEDDKNIMNVLKEQNSSNLSKRSRDNVTEFNTYDKKPKRFKIMKYDSDSD